MGPDREHPVVAAIAIAAVFLSIGLIAWAGVQVHGTGEIEALFSEEPVVAKFQQDEGLAQAVALARWAGGVTQ
jgi:hypothetical protein